MTPALWPLPFLWPVVVWILVWGWQVRARWTGSHASIGFLLIVGALVGPAFVIFLVLDWNRGSGHGPWGNRDRQSRG